MFTKDGLVEADLRRPPVDGCKCTYCSNMLRMRCAVRGEGSARSHRLRGGNEAHNPENITRLALQKLVPAGAFKGYVSKRGGDMLWFQNPRSKLWYAAGRTRDTYPGHFVHVYLKKEAPERECLAWLCIPVSGMSLPLAGVVMAHYLALTLEEVTTWERAAVSYIDPAAVPDFLQEAAPDEGNEHHLEWTGPHGLRGQVDEDLDPGDLG